MLGGFPMSNNFTVGKIDDKYSINGKDCHG